jgi:hypothetical protein
MVLMPTLLDLSFNRKSNMTGNAHISGCIWNGNTIQKGNDATFSGTSNITAYRGATLVTSVSTIIKSKMAATKQEVVITLVVI